MFPLHFHIEVDVAVQQVESDMLDLAGFEPGSPAGGLNS